MDPYLLDLISDKDAFLAGLRRQALAENVPIVREDTAALLRVLTGVQAPRRILEAGTAIGYSSILMAKAAPEAHIDTVEIDPEMVLKARGNVAAAGLEDRINVILGDAAEVLACLSCPYDMIFVDSAKSQYIQMYGDIKRLLAPGGLLVCDNVIFYGKIFDSPADAPHKHRTIVSNMRAFLERLSGDGDFTVAILETGDGVATAKKK